MVAISLATLALLLFGYITFGEGRFPDFTVFLTAGERFAEGAALYQQSDGHYQFKYLPLAAAYFAPFSTLPSDLARFLWLVIIVFCIAVTLYLSWRLINHRQRGAWALVLPTILVMGKFYLREIDLGQSNAVMTALLMVMLSRLLDKKDLSAGALLAAAITIKPYAAIFLPYLALKRRWRSFFSALALLIVALFLPAVWYGWSGNVELLQQWVISLSHSTPGLLENADNVSLFGFFAKWLGPAHTNLVYPLSLGVVALLLTGVALVSTRNLPQNTNARRAQLLESGTLLALIPLLTPQGWDYVFLCATLGVMILIAERHRLAPVARWSMFLSLVLIGATIYDVMGSELYRAFMQMSVLTLSYFAVVIFLLLLRVRLTEELPEKPRARAAANA